MPMLTTSVTVFRRVLFETMHQSSRNQSVPFRSLHALHLAESSSTLISNECNNRITRGRMYASATTGGSSSNSRSSKAGPPPFPSSPPSSPPSSSPPYVSPFQEIFDTIREGKTFLGTTEFQAPNVKRLRCGAPEHALKFKTTTYGRLLEEPFVRPMEHRVTLQVAIRHIPLSDSELLVLKEIVGSRYNEETGVLQLSSSQFGSRIENKRHVVSMLERIVDSARTLAERVDKEVLAMDA